MDIGEGVFSAAFCTAAGIVAALALLWAARGARTEAALRGHAWPAMVVAVLVLWQMRAVTDEGPALHLLGATLLQLCFGWRLALLGIAAVITAHTANGAGAWSTLGVGLLILGALPVAVSHALTRTVNRRMPGNPFAYILIAGFAGGGLSMVAVLAASTLTLLALGSTDASRVLDQYALSGILIVFPEAFVTGAVLAPLAMFQPQLVATWTPPWDPRNEA